GQLLAPLGTERPARILKDDNAIEPEGAEALPQLAPADERPDLAPEPEAQRADGALGDVLLLVAVVEPQYPPVLHRTFQNVDNLPLGITDAPARRLDLSLGNAVLFGVGKNSADLDQRLFRRTRHGRATEGAHHARSSHQSHDLITREHEWRKLKAITHQVSDTCLAIDRDTRRLKIRDIAIDSTV